MRQVFRAALLLCGVAVGACDFAAQQGYPDGGGPADQVSIGFVATTSTQDEASGRVAIEVTLSGPPDGEVTVDYQLGGSAQQGNDYTATDGTLTFSPNQTKQTIAIEILNDTFEETDETVDLTLSGITGNARLGVAKHTMTISANALPRVNFTMAASNDPEAVGVQQLNVSLSAPTNIAASVAYTVAGTASASDHTLIAGTVDFPANTQSQIIQLPIMQDLSDEDPETVEVTLTSSSNVVIGAMNKRIDTIIDDDDPPTVSIQATSLGLEGSIPILSLFVDIDVTLSVASGKVITVPMTLAGPSADYGYANGSGTLTFNPGTLTQKVRLLFAGDQIDEDNEQVTTSINSAALDLEKVRPGSPLSNVTTINDDDNAPEVNFVTASRVDNEGNGNGAQNVEYTLQVDGATERTVGFTVEILGSSTAQSPADYAASGLSFSLPPGTNSGKVTLAINRDNSREQDETINMQVSTTGLTNVSVGGQSQRTHTIKNDD